MEATYATVFGEMNSLKRPVWCVSLGLSFEIQNVMVVALVCDVVVPLLSSSARWAYSVCARSNVARKELRLIYFMKTDSYLCLECVL